MPRHIALIVHAFHGGGAERVAATMANLWAERGDRVTAITLDSVGSDVFRVDSKVERLGLGLMAVSRNQLAAIWNNRRRIRALRAAIRSAHPDCVVSVTDQMNILTLLAARGLKVPVIIAEHSDPRHQRMGSIRERLRRRMYPRAAAIVVLTQAVADYLKSTIGPQQYYVIPNGISRPSAQAVERADADPLIVSMGRLSEEKGFDTLIDAFAKLAPEHSDWRLQIAGEGPQRDLLERQATQLDLASRIDLVGWVDDPFAFMNRAAIYVLSSRYEGFPVSLLEAMSLGLAVVSFDCDSGPREIISDGHNGLLVPAGDQPALAAAMGRLIKDPPLCAVLGAAAKEVVDQFSPERFEQRWDEVLRKTL